MWKQNSKHILKLKVEVQILWSKLPVITTYGPMDLSPHYLLYYSYTSVRLGFVLHSYTTSSALCKVYKRAFLHHLESFVSYI